MALFKALPPAYFPSAAAHKPPSALRAFQLSSIKRFGLTGGSLVLRDDGVVCLFIKIVALHQQYARDKNDGGDGAYHQADGEKRWTCLVNEVGHKAGKA